MLGDEELLPTAQAATLEILHSVLASASHADGTSVGAASQVAQVLLDAWKEAETGG